MTQKEKDELLEFLNEQLMILQSIDASLELQLIDLEKRRESLSEEIYENVKAGIEEELEQARERINGIEESIAKLETLEPDE